MCFQHRTVAYYLILFSFIVDKPKDNMIINSDDKPKKDLLERNGFARQIAKGLIQATTTETSGFVVGLTGKWGSGKTTLLNNVKDVLIELCQEKEISYKIIEFNPWALTDSENLKRSFLKEFNSQIRGKKVNSLKRIFLFFSKILKQLGGISNSTAAKAGQALGNLIQNYLDSDSSIVIKKKIDDVLLQANKKIFVFFG